MSGGEAEVGIRYKVSGNKYHNSLFGFQMQFKVPQKIDIEDKIIGPLSMVQFVYAVVGGFLTYTVFTKLPAPFGWFLGFIVGILTFMVVFVKINGHPFTHFLRNALIYFVSPKTRIWHKGDSDVSVQIYQPAAQKKVDPYASKHYNKADFERLAQVLDKRGQVSGNEMIIKN